uniref:Protein phosphatase 1 regulatory subunit 12B n=1 Tax=Xenopus tropicalis TaxID=8364 RepID=F7EGT7_XENTR
KIKCEAICHHCLIVPRISPERGNRSLILHPPLHHRLRRRCVYGALNSFLGAVCFTHERLSRLDSGSSGLGSTDSTSDRASSRVSAYSRRENRLTSLESKNGEETEKDFKKLYENAYSENEKLKTNLREAQLELSVVKAKLERVAKRQDQSSSQAEVLEAEKREKRVLERRMSEMEDELKILTDLKSDNQRLKDENGALIRVISKLSK